MWINAYKGFNNNMTCRGFQYQEGEIYEINEEAKLCNSGFHACEAPLDCLTYYAPTQSEYHAVQLDATEERDKNDTKRVGRKIKIGARLSIKNLVDAQIEYVREHADQIDSSTGDRAANSSTGDWAANSSTGYWAANVSTGNESCNEGTDGSINIGWGKDNMCRGSVGAYLVLCERGEWDGEKHPLIGEPQLVKVDGTTIKANTWYTMKGGKIVETTEEIEHD